jgi:hypothetical protein
MGTKALSFFFLRKQKGMKTEELRKSRALLVL